MSEKNIVKWGIIGCGDVAERKSGPAFYKNDNSRLVAVMRRDRAKAEDFARKHGVAAFYDNATDLIADPQVEAVYVATPPDSHADYATEAMMAGKPVYVEKPVALDYEQCARIAQVSRQAQVPVYVAYYRRALPYFLRIKEILDSGVLGSILAIDLRFLRPPQSEDYENPLPWRLQKAHSGGGYIQDMGSHQIDLLMFLFGKIVSVKNNSSNRGGLYQVEDTVAALFGFENGLSCTALWCFATSELQREDSITVIGTSGYMRFSVFEMDRISLHTTRGEQQIVIPFQEHVQQPMIRLVSDWILSGNHNKAWLDDAFETTKILEQLTLK